VSDGGGGFGLMRGRCDLSGTGGDIRRLSRLIIRVERGRCTLVSSSVTAMSLDIVNSMLECGVNAKLPYNRQRRTSQERTLITRLNVLNFHKFFKRDRFANLVALYTGNDEILSDPDVLRHELCG
jgi:hypothetical protein